MDSDPWPEQADGEGPYLQLVDISSDNSLASNWIASSQSLSIEDIATAQRQIIVYPNPTKGIVTIEFDFSNTDALEFSIYNSMGQSVGDFVVHVCSPVFGCSQVTVEKFISRNCNSCPLLSSTVESTRYISQEFLH